MSLAVKIFIVLNLLLCLAFAYVNMVNYATRENWKRRWNEDTTKALTEAKLNADLAVKRGVEAAKANNDVKVRDTQILDLQAKVAELSNTIKERDGTILAQKEEKQRKDADYNALNENFMAQGQSLEKARTRMTELNHIAQVARGTAFNLSLKLAEVEDDLNNEVNKNTQQQEKIDQQDKSLQKNAAFIAFVRDNFRQVYEAAIDNKSGATAVSAVVSLVRSVGPGGEQDVVVLSVGQNQIQAGTEFIVHRGGTYICKVRVATVLKDQATCRILPDSWGDKKIQVAVGDNAISGH
jgi:hypothetical protein